ncbi:MAG: hypothetical protein ACJA0N_001829 [Pseudohongiellaceae bacterium]|jgi:hypothetical protein
MKIQLVILCLLIQLFLLTGCTTAPPKSQDNICKIFGEKDWYEDAADAREEWGSSIGVMMAMMHQESRFKANAQPPREWLFGIIPWFRSSSAYGYSQAKNGTWEDYQRSSGNYGADRDDFDDAVDFIGWYNSVSQKRCSIKPNDTYHLYLAYHEGHGGFNRRTYNNKAWLKKVAKKVSAKARQYNKQLKGCEESLKDPWWYLF